MKTSHYDLTAAARRWPAATSGERFTLMVLVSYMGLHDDEWSAWPGNETLAADTLQTERTIKRHLAVFAEVGLISTRRRVRTEGRGAMSNVIVLDAERLIRGTPCHLDPGPGGHHVTLIPPTKVTSESDQGDMGDPTKVTSDASAPHIEELVEQPGEDGVAAATRLCDLLADLVEANGSKRPTITKRWVEAADRMIRLDGRTPEQIENCMRWSQSDEFWRANILSMPKLRERYDTLRLQAMDRRRARAVDSTLQQRRELLFDGEGQLVDA